MRQKHLTDHFSAISNRPSSVKVTRSAASSLEFSQLEIMLGEYQYMTTALAKLTEAALASLETELESTLHKLTSWLNKTAAINTTELFAALRQLKHQANNLCVKDAGKNLALPKFSLARKYNYTTHSPAYQAAMA